MRILFFLFSLFFYFQFHQWMHIKIMRICLTEIWRIKSIKHKWKKILSGNVNGTDLLGQPGEKEKNH